MASTRCQSVALSYPYGPIFNLISPSSESPAPSDAMAIGSAARQVIDLTDDDEDGLPLSSEIPGPSRQVIDLTIDDDDDGDGDGDGVAEVRRLRTGRPARCHVRLIPPPLVDRLAAVDQLPSTPTVLLAEVSHTQRRRHSNCPECETLQYAYTIHGITVYPNDTVTLNFLALLFAKWS